MTCDMLSVDHTRMCTGVSPSRLHSSCERGSNMQWVDATHREYPARGKEAKGRLAGRTVIGSASTLGRRMAHAQLV